VRCLKNQFPQAEIHFLTKKRNVDLLMANPYIDKIHIYNDSIEETIKGLRAENFDFIIDLHHNLRTLWVKIRLKAKSYSYNKLNFRKLLFTSVKINSLPKVHIVARKIEPLTPF